MKRTMLSNLVSLIALGTSSLVACADDPAAHQDNTAIRQALDASSVSLRQSVSIAEGTRQDNRALKATVFTRSNVLSVDAVSAGVAQNLRIDPSNGNVLATTDLAAPESGCESSVGLDAAIAAAEAAVGGEAVVIQPDDDGECNREVKVLDADDVLWEVKVAPNGSVIEQEVADDGAETDE